LEAVIGLCPFRPLEDGVAGEQPSSGKAKSAKSAGKKSSSKPSTKETAKSAKAAKPASATSTKQKSKTENPPDLRVRRHDLDVLLLTQSGKAR
jgi:hypothetical protein